jgi:hypothetical protein
MIAASSEAAIAGPKVEPKTDKAKSNNISNFFMIIFLSFYGTATALNIRGRCYFKNGISDNGKNGTSSQERDITDR